MLEFGLFLVASYFIGSIPMAFLVTRWRYHADIRKYGSGQVGASNVYRNFSKKIGILVGIYDAGKGALVVWIAHMFGMDTTMQVAIGIAVIIGHNWPVFLHFNAGRGLATTIGVSLYLLPLGIPGLLFCAIFTLIIGSSPLPLLAAVATLPLSSWGLGKPLALTLGLTAIFFILVIRRLTAPKTARSASVRTGKLLLNRFLFDRDIQDGQAWITFKPITGDKPKKPEKE
jgi:glycerol-3-phosphate acyltransferase PlsY